MVDPGPARSATPTPPPTGSVEDVLAWLYRLALGRDPDEAGRRSFLPGLEAGTVTARQVLEWIVTSDEWSARLSELGPSLHRSRGTFIRSLPPARRILDLGGTARGSQEGALVRMGYPYPFERLTIVDLPSTERHELYRDDEDRRVVATPLGPVAYEYHSMTDLSRYPHSSFDLVVSGQSIEHVTWDEADRVLEEVWRVLAPGGFLAVDTPNARVTRLQQRRAAWRGVKAVRRRLARPV